MNKVLIIGDEKNDSFRNISEKIFYAWNGQENSSYSLINFIFKNKKSLREDYLKFIENIHKKEKKGFTSKILNYKIYSRYNIFEMSNVSEKNIFKSPKIIDCIKFLAIKKIIKKNKILKINYIGFNLDILNSLKLLCKDNDLSFYSDNNFLFKKKNSYIILNFLKSIFYLLNYFFVRINIINFKTNFSHLYGKKILLFSYYVHLKKNKLSNLWGNLSETLIKNKYKINWLHDYSPSNQVQSPKIFLKNINFLNDKNNNHIPLDSFLNFTSIIKIFINFLIIFFLFLFIKMKKVFYYKKKKINFFYFLEEDFKKSIFGPDLIKNLIYIEIYENIFSTMSKNKIGLYLLENQAWEYIMIKAWKHYKHGKIIGSINSTVRDWDLRYFKTKNYRLKSKINYPDYLAVNGKLTKKIILKNKLINKKKIFNVEAVRYNYLQKVDKVAKIINSVIVFGDISINSNYEILKDLEKSLKYLKKKFSFYYKPHPTLPKKVVDDLFIKFSFLKKIKKLHINYYQFEYCICSETTSAILEAIYFRLKTVIYVCKDSLNLNPLPSNLWNNYAYNYQDFVNFFVNSSKKKQIFINKLIDINFKNRKWLQLIKKADI